MIVKHHTLDMISEGYLDALSGLRAFGWPTILALAATATADVVADIERQPETGL